MVNNIDYYKFKDEFDQFCQDADIRLFGESYDIALMLYIELDDYEDYDDAIKRVDRFNKFIDIHNKF
jgi:hypothetical protein